MSSPMPWFNFPQLWSTKQQLQTALISEQQITTSSKRLLLNLALRNGYLALQPGAAHVHHLHMILLVDSLPSSESIEGKHLAKQLCHVRQFQLTILSKFNDFFRSFDGSLWGIRAAASLAFCWSMRCWDTSCSTTSATLRASWKCDLAIQFKPIQK